MKELDINIITEKSKKKVLAYAYKLSGEIPVTTQNKYVRLGSKILRFLRVALNPVSLLIYEEEQQIYQTIVETYQKR